MSLIYTCDVCGKNMKSLKTAQRHAAKCVKELVTVKHIELNWNPDKAAFEFSVYVKDNTEKSLCNPEHIYAGYCGTPRLSTLDLSEEHELECKQRLYDSYLSMMKEHIKKQKELLEKLKDLGKDLGKAFR